MKKLFFSLTTMLSLSTLIAQNVGINTNTPHASAALDVVSTTQGVLVPRMTQSDRNLIASPATGLLVYQTDATPGFYFYNGSAWTSLSGGGGTTYNAGTGISIAGNVISNTGDNDNSSSNEIELPAQSGQGGKYLTTDGTNTSWATVSGGGSLPSQTGNSGKVLTTDGTNASWISKQERYLFESTPENSTVNGHIIRMWRSAAPSFIINFTGNVSSNPNLSTTRIVRGTSIFSTAKTIKSAKYFYTSNNFQGTATTSVPGSIPISGQQNISFIIQKCNANAPITETLSSNTCVDLLSATVPLLTSDVVQLTTDTWVNLPLNSNTTLTPNQYLVIKVNQNTNAGNVSTIPVAIEVLVE